MDLDSSDGSAVSTDVPTGRTQSAPRYYGTFPRGAGATSGLKSDPVRSHQEDDHHERGQDREVKDRGRLRPGSGPTLPSSIACRSLETAPRSRTLTSTRSESGRFREWRAHSRTTSITRARSPPRLYDRERSPRCSRVARYFRTDRSAGAEPAQQLLDEAHKINNGIMIAAE